jgi:hypothetical protein
MSMLKLGIGWVTDCDNMFGSEIINSGEKHARFLTFYQDYKIPSASSIFSDLMTLR